MRCPKCNKAMHVNEQRNDVQMNETYRKYICAYCGKVVFTGEFEVERNAKFEELWEKCKWPK